MKKFLSLLLIATLGMFTLIGCGEVETAEETSEAETTVEEGTEVVETEIESGDEIIITTFVTVNEDGKVVFNVVDGYNENDFIFDKIEGVDLDATTTYYVNITHHIYSDTEEGAKVIETSEEETPESEATEGSEVEEDTSEVSSEDSETAATDDTAEGTDDTTNATTESAASNEL